MEVLSLSIATTWGNCSGFRLSVPSFSNFRNYRYKSCVLLPQTKRRKKLLVYAAADNENSNKSEFSEWVNAQLQFGYMIGEDPELTLAKMVGRKSHPELSDLELQKLYKKEGRAAFPELDELPFDLTEIRRKSSAMREAGISKKKVFPGKLSGVKLVRPVVPKKGFKYEINSKPRAIKIPSKPVVKPVDESLKSGPSITLRKPSSFNSDNVGTENSLGLSGDWSSSLKMSKGQSKERLTDSMVARKPDPYVLENKEEASQGPQALVNNGIEENNRISLLQKPEIVNLNLNDDQKLTNSAKAILTNNSIQSETSTNVSLLQKPEIVNLNLNDDQKPDNSTKAVPTTNSIQSETSTNVSLLQKPEIGYLDLKADPKREDSGGQRQSNSGISTETMNARNINLDQSLESRDTSLQRDYNASLQEQPKRLDHSAEQRLTKSGEGRSLVNPESSSIAVEDENIPTVAPIQEHEDKDWAKAEDLIKEGGRVDVEVISATNGGFAVSFGSLIGLLPYRNVSIRWRYSAFESWLRKKGLDPSKYKKNLGIAGKLEATHVETFVASIANSKAASEVKVGGELSPDMKLEDLLVIYDQEKLKYSISFVGQKTKAYVILADRESRKLIFSAKQKEKEESIEKKKRLMAKLSVGDVVKCCVTKITYFGIFVEVEGVSALIHQTELSWDTTLELSTHFKIGQVIDAKVIQLDFVRGFILLSLKELKPDPLIETLESELSDQASLKAVEADTEWTDVDSLVKELEQYEGIQSVSKGQYFLSPALAPTFQVYMASMFEDQYKLLARSENKVQEVIVKSSLSKEEMKTAIHTCTNRVK